MPARPPGVPVNGVPLHPTSLAAAVELVVDAAEGGRPLAAHLVNSFTMSEARQDGRLLDVLVRADLNLIDGTPLAWLVGRRCGSHVCPVRGADLLRSCLQRPELRHFLLGGRDGSTADRLAGQLADAYPDAKVVRVEAPPYPYDWASDVARVADDAHRVGANVIWVGLGTPQQDHLAAALAEQARLPVIPVGAAFDFLAGRVQEAPLRLRGSGFEWAYRLGQEPRRLWRRYLRGNWDMVSIALRDGYRRGR